MMRLLKRLFTQRCATCGQSLQVEHTPLACIKTCPAGHYAEETYHHLGVRVTYKDQS